MSESLSKSHKEAQLARDESTKNILTATGDKKVVVAGPGTGKTFLFKEFFATTDGTNKLTLTFINALVEDLSLELRGISEVRTLHGYALGNLPEGQVKVFPDLHAIIRDDGTVLLGEDIDFKKKIHEIDEADGHLEFYSSRRKYYGHFGYSDIILGLVRWFQEKPERIPSYSQIVVDEFQDFNQLEVALILIEQLATKSPIVIAGDDDQAIYNFKSARSDFIREVFGDTKPEYAAFTLPFCSRSTKVIVDCVNDIVRIAVAQGFLNGRVDKRYDYFTCPEKDQESEAEPKIIHRRLEDGQIAWFITKEMDKIAEKRREKFDVLVISPFTGQGEKIGNALIGKGLKSVEFKEKHNKELSYLDGLRLLTQRKTGQQSNLGWRIASRFKLSDEIFSEILMRSKEEDPLPFGRLVPADTKAQIDRDVELLKTIKNKEPISTEEIDTLLNSLSLDQDEIKINHVREELLTGHSTAQGLQAIKKIPITLSTIQSSKGLSSEYVFITHFDSRYIPREGDVTDQDICNMLVALTRARKKVWLLSTTDEPCVFLNWIDKNRIEKES